MTDGRDLHHLIFERFVMLHHVEIETDDDGELLLALRYPPQCFRVIQKHGLLQELNESLL
jgi:hypothetical protein